MQSRAKVEKELRAAHDQIAELKARLHDATVADQMMKRWVAVV